MYYRKVMALKIYPLVFLVCFLISSTPCIPFPVNVFIGSHGVSFQGMHPSISAFPSWRFYRGELKNAVTDADRPMPPGGLSRNPQILRFNVR